MENEENKTLRGIICKLVSNLPLNPEEEEKIEKIVKESRYEEESY